VELGHHRPRATRHSSTARTTPASPASASRWRSAPEASSSVASAFSIRCAARRGGSAYLRAARRNYLASGRARSSRRRHDRLLDPGLSSAIRSQREAGDRRATAQHRNECRRSDARRVSPTHLGPNRDLRRDGAGVARAPRGSPAGGTRRAPHVLRLPDFDRADAIGTFWGDPETRTFGKLLIDLEEDKAARAVVFGSLAEMERK
jgi:hypothetical protein